VKFRKKNLDIRLVLGVTLLIALLLMISDKSKEFGVNLFTEITGVAITVFVINKILERKERQKRIAIDHRILRELQSIIASYFSIWKHLTWKYLPEVTIENEDDFLKIYPGLVRLASIHDRFEVVSIHHPESWKLFYHNRTIKECFDNYNTTLTGEIQILITDFKMYLEPELFDKLLNIMECTYFKNMIMMGQEGTEKVLQELELDITRLDSYISPDDQNHIVQFANLLLYSKDLKVLINKFSDVNFELYELKKYFIHPAKFVNALLNYPDNTPLQEKYFLNMVDPLLILSVGGIKICINYKVRIHNFNALTIFK
jgi:hypothetical protein